MALIAQYHVATTLFEVLTKDFSVASVCSRYMKGLMMMMMMECCSDGHCSSSYCMSDLCGGQSVDPCAHGTVSQRWSHNVASCSSLPMDVSIIMSTNDKAHTS